MMKRSPRTPNTLTLRQIECISCHETFDPEAGPVENSARPARFECPRCGANNRNWVHILEGAMGDWFQRFPLATLGLVLTLLLAGLGLQQVYAADMSFGRQLGITLIILLTGGITTLVITRQWKKLREYGYLSPLTRADQKTVDPIIKSSAILFIIFVPLLPFILFIVRPAMMHVAANILSPEAPATYLSRIDTLSDRLPTALAEADEIKPSVRNALLSLREILSEEEQGMITADAPLDEMAGFIMGRLRLRAEGVISPEVQQRIDNNFPALESFLSIRPRRWFTIGVDFLGIWLTYVGLTWLATSLLAGWSTHDYTSNVNRQLPRPIFTSVPAMKQAAIWEANRTLELGRMIERIQWISVQRNEKHGIDMMGLFRDPPEFSSEGGLSDKVRAQEYFIRTDKWARIEAASINDKFVPPAAGAPSVVDIPHRQLQAPAPARR